MGETDALQPTRPRLLDGSSPDAEARLRALGVRRRFPAGVSMFFHGDAAHDALIVLSGAVKITLSSTDGREVILDVVGEGGLVGELSAVDGAPRSATATTLTDVEVLSIPCDRFIAHLHSCPELMYRLLLSVTGRLRNSIQRQLEYGTGDAMARTCRRLVELADRYGTVGKDGYRTVALPVSQGDLAAWAGLSREAVVKALRTLRDLGWISGSGRDVTILEPAKLLARATT